ncbi:hypothetical protein M378DRAFT_159551 [Amanita muscaria Koide BX008]|uniref:Uncharacterized protein n=1 Tax=Amanita muscaria (strain Koide BX008) TaxID=946122 RepID=A0A0C2XFQ0_AMAMK|nr:hypothetical protein M378DRAFT_159551 [Amanita muscaria Koide BX008]
MHTMSQKMPMGFQFTAQLSALFMKLGQAKNVTYKTNYVQGTFQGYSPSSTAGAMRTFERPRAVAISGKHVSAFYRTTRAPWWTILGTSVR